jgi:hypothetical protein
VLTLHPEESRESPNFSYFSYIGICKFSKNPGSRSVSFSGRVDDVDVAANLVN